ncbi:MAG: hypothetical protein KAG56_09750, partial [Sulfurovaceae bacterium]|nr:hypothetical protein [Sulfurovaceae bacterium]
KSLRDFVSSKSTPTPSPVITQPSISNAKVKDDSLQSTLDELIASGKIKSLSLKYDKSTYNTGDLVTFKIDTLGEQGFLSIFYVDSDEVTVLYPNPYVSTKKLSGSYMFPNDLSNGKFDVEAYKVCKGCTKEQTSIYVLLSPEPITDIKNISSSELLSFKKGSYKSKILIRAVKIKVASEKAGMQPMLSKYEFIVK